MEEGLTQNNAFLPAPGSGGKKRFSMVLVTIYSIENAGIRYVSAALQREGVDTHIVFLKDWVHNRLTMPSETEFRAALDLIREKQADMVGIGFMSSLLPMAEELNRRVKSEFPGVPVVWGGIHPTSAPEESIQEADFLCQGEGELAVVDLVKALSAGDDTTTIPNIWANVDGVIHAMRASATMPGVDRIWVPGEQSHEIMTRRTRDGIPIPETLLAQLDGLADGLKIGTLI
mgnify:CR=1 FL=1